MFTGLKVDLSCQIVERWSVSQVILSNLALYPKEAQILKEEEMGNLLVGIRECFYDEKQLWRFKKKSDTKPFHWDSFSKNSEDIHGLIAPCFCLNPTEAVSLISFVLVTL